MQSDAIVFIIFGCESGFTYLGSGHAYAILGMAKGQLCITIPNPHRCQDIVVGRISTFRTTHIQTNTKRNIAQRIC